MQRFTALLFFALLLSLALLFTGCKETDKPVALPTAVPTVTPTVRPIITAVPTAVPTIRDTVSITEAKAFLPDLADMPSGYTLDGESMNIGNDGFAADRQQVMDKLGRVAGYHRLFVKNGLNLIGNSMVTTDIVLFADAAGAVGAVDYYAQNDFIDNDDYTFTDVKEVSMPKLGDKRIAISASMTGKDDRGNQQTWDITEIIVQYDASIATIYGVSAHSAGDFDQLVTLAQIMAARLP